MMPDDDELLDERAAAEALNIKPGTLSIWRSTGRYPLPYVKIGRYVRCRRGDLRAFIRQRTRLHSHAV